MQKSSHSVHNMHFRLVVVAKYWKMSTAQDSDK